MRQWQSVFSGPYGFELEQDGDIPTLRMHTMTWFPRQIPYLNYWLWVRNGLMLYRRYVKAYGTPDVVHAHGMIYGGLLAWNIKRRYGVPFVITEHGTAYARNLFAPWELKVAAKAAAAADYRLAVSEAFCHEMAQFLGSQWEACPNVVSPAFTNYSLPPSSLPAPEEKRPFVFTMVAYLSVRKGIHHLISAFAQSFKGDETTLLRIGGDGQERDRLEALAEELGVTSQVEFLGALDRHEVRDLMARTDAFVLSSRYETFGVVVIEALALGKPVISTRCGGPNRVVQSQDGLLIPPEDVAAMAKAMRYLKDHIDDYDSQAIRQSCIDRFGESAIASQLDGIYGAVTQSKNTAKKLAGTYA